MGDSENNTKTQADTEGCSGTDPRATDRENNTDNLIDEGDVLDAQLPDELRSALGHFVGSDSIDTLREWTSGIRSHTGGGAIDSEQLCHTDTESEHWGEVGKERYYFQCFYDAVILAAIEERPVDIRTVSPDGTVVEAQAVGSVELLITPKETVFSFGIELDAYERSSGSPTLQDGYAAICPYVRAFPDHTAYEQWAETVPATTVALPLAGATDVARALVA